MNTDRKIPKALRFAWVIVDYQGSGSAVPIPRTMRPDRIECIRDFLRGAVLFVSWDAYYRRGYRCRKIDLEEWMVR